MDYFQTFDNLISHRLTFRAVGTGEAGDELSSYENCHFTKTETLEQYYRNRDGDDNPFSEMTIKGTEGTQWKWTAFGNLRLTHNTVKKSGATRLKVKSGYAVELRITVGEEDFILGKNSKAPVVRLESNPERGLIRKDVNYTTSQIDYSWPVGGSRADGGSGYTDSPVYGKEQIDVVLVGDSGDYLSMDLEGQWDGIAKFRLKLGNDTYKNVGIEDINGNSYIEVLGVCKIDETSESGVNVKIMDYRGYPIWRDDSGSPFIVTVKGNVTGVSTLFTQEYTNNTEAEGAIAVAKVWIDNKIDSGDRNDDTIYGCTDSEATNYNSAATVDDGSCSYGDENDDSTISIIDKMKENWVLVGLGIVGLALLG